MENIGCRLLITKTRRYKVFLIEEMKSIAATNVRYPIIRDTFVFASLTGLRISDIHTQNNNNCRKLGKRNTENH